MKLPLKLKKMPAIVREETSFLETDLLSTNTGCDHFPQKASILLFSVITTKCSLDYMYI